jgi:hypothetical protein
MLKKIFKKFFNDAIFLFRKILFNYYMKNEKKTSNERVVVKIKLSQASNNEDLKLTYTDDDYSKFLEEYR